MGDPAGTRVHELAGRPAPSALLPNIPRLVTDYFAVKPDPAQPNQRVVFGTSGHRGSSERGSFNENHILAISQAIAEHRASRGISGPLYLGIDTHALSEPARATALEVFAAHEIRVRVAPGDGYAATPLVSHAVLAYNRSRRNGLADGVVITPSHNPPEDGGFKYDPPEGGPADAATTKAIEKRANRILAEDLWEVRRVPFARAVRADTTEEYDFVGPYVEDLRNLVDMEAIARSGIRIGVDPLGGASLPVWGPIAETYGLTLEIVNRAIDPRFAFMTVDHDGRIRMDCSSPYAMARLIGMKDRFDIAFGNDTDADRFGVVVPGDGLMNPNHILAAQAWYLFRNRPEWPGHAALGKTLVTSSMLDRVAARLGRKLLEVPVGFKWFVEGLLDGTTGFCGEESAGASFLRRDGSVWTTDKDGIAANLLAAEMRAVTGRDPGETYEELTRMFGRPAYARVDAPASPRQKRALAELSPEAIEETDLAGEPVQAILSRAPGNGAAIGGLKVVTENGWFAARPSGTEDVYKIYAESFRGDDHLRRILEEAQGIVNRVFAKARFGNANGANGAGKRIPRPLPS